MYKFSKTTCIVAIVSLFVATWYFLLGALSVNAAERVPMIRMYNPAINDHFYTSNRLEADEATLLHGYRLEGEMGYMYRYEQANTEPVYRMWNPKAGKHFYTTSLDENRSALNSGFLQEGILGFVPNQYSGGGEVGLFRLYSPSEKKHFYTTHIGERDMLVAKGYAWEGYLGYGLFAGDVPPDFSNDDFISTSTLAINAELGKQGRWPMSFQYKGTGPVTLNWSVTDKPQTMYLENNGPITLNNNDFFTLYLGGTLEMPVVVQTLQLHLTTSRGYSETFGITYSTTGGNFVNCTSSSGIVDRLLTNAGTKYGLLYPSTGIDGFPVWSSDCKKLYVKDSGKWLTLELEKMSLTSGTWRGGIPISINTASGSVRSASAEEIQSLSILQAGTHHDLRYLMLSNGIKIELVSELFSTIMYRTDMSGFRQELWRSDFENCYSLVASPHGTGVSFTCELNGLLYYNAE